MEDTARPLSPPAIRRAASEWLDTHPGSLRAAPPAPTPKRSHGKMHTALAGMAAGQAADAYTTLAALRRPGTKEANPLYGDRPSAARVIATKAAAMVPAAYVLDKLYDRKPKTALALAIGLGTLGGAVALRNSKQGRGQ